MSSKEPEWTFQKSKKCTIIHFAYCIFYCCSEVGYQTKIPEYSFNRCLAKNPENLKKICGVRPAKFMKTLNYGSSCNMK